MNSSTANRIIRAGLLAGACTLVLACAPPAAKTPDLNGVWVTADSFMDTQDGTFLAAPARAEATEREGKIAFGEGGLPKLKGEYAERFAAARAAEKEAEARGQPLGTPSADCIPPGMPTFWIGPYAFEIVQSAKQINIFQESWEQTRRVYLDGRTHPSLDDADPLYQGHSIGKWEGDTLVVDSVNFVSQTMLMGAPHSDKMQIAERLRLIEPDLLEIQMTVQDADALEEPWVSTRKLRRKPGMEIRDYICAENNRNRSDANGVTQAILQPK